MAGPPAALSVTGYANPLPGVTPGSGFGMRMHPIKHRMILHAGVDLPAPTGTPVYAVTDGTVTLKPLNGGAGNTIELKAGNGDVFKYFHLSAFSVPPGARVTAGQAIGKVGTTGSSTGPHLHFEWHPGGGAAVDPMSILTGGPAAPQASAGGLPVPTPSSVIGGVSLLTNPATWLRVAMSVAGVALVGLGAAIVISDTRLGSTLAAAGIDAGKVAALGPAGAAL